GCDTNPGFFLELGIANSCDHDTVLTGSAGHALSVSTTGGTGVALSGSGKSLTGSGLGVFGQTLGGGDGAYGVYGDLFNIDPGDPSAGVFGDSFSPTANGPGVFGQHVSVDGTAPGVLGQTSSTAAGSAAVKGLGGPCSTCLGMIGTAPGNGVGVLGQA